MVIVNGISLPDLARITRRGLERLKYAAKRAGIRPAARIGTIGLYTVDAAVEIVLLGSEVRAYNKRRKRRGKVES